MRKRWTVVLLGLTSCRAACGLDELEGTGGAGGAPSSSSNGGAGGTTDVATTSSTGGGGGGAGEACHAVVSANGVTFLHVEPDPNTGFWDGTPAPYVHVASVSPPFIARTMVRAYDPNASEQWPGQPFQLAGLVVRGDQAPAESSIDWFKAEIGTLDQPSDRGMRTARKVEAGPPPRGQWHDGPPLNTTDAEFFEVAICVDDAGVARGYYREAALGLTWGSVGEEIDDNGPFTGSVDVGLVAAATGPNGSLAADFAFIDVREVEGTFTQADCLCYLRANGVNEDGSSAEEAGGCGGSGGGAPDVAATPLCADDFDLGVNTLAPCLTVESACFPGSQ